MTFRKVHNFCVQAYACPEGIKLLEKHKGDLEGLFESVPYSKGLAWLGERVKDRLEDAGYDPPWWLRSDTDTIKSYGWSRFKKWLTKAVNL